MRVIIALGGNALLRRGQPLDVAVQRSNAAVAVAAIAEVNRNGREHGGSRPHACRYTRASKARLAPESATIARVIPAAVRIDPRPSSSNARSA